MDERNGEWRPGAFVWREIASTDLDAATRFYGELLGWKHHDSQGGNGVYRHFTAGDTDVAGGWQIGPQMGPIPSHWIAYLSIPDVDAAAAQAKERGAKVHMGPMDLPKVGRVAYLQDPQGASVAFFRDLKGDPPAKPPPYGAGVFCWESLMVSDPAAAADFYASVAGMHQGEFQGQIMLASAASDQDGVADVGTVPPGAPPHWLSHVVVEDLAASRDRAQRLGGRILAEEIAIPTVGRMAVVADPTGAMLSLFEPERRS